MRPGFTRRSLLRRGGAGAASASVLGGLALPARAAAQADEGRAPSALLVVLPLVRADHVNAFEGGSGTDTPNLDELTGDSLRFDRAIPECMPSLPVRRTLVTGMRSYPFRDWKRTDGLPAVPGYNPVWDWQPVMTENMRAGGVKTAYVTDNPMLEGPRFPDVRRPGGSVLGDERKRDRRRDRGSQASVRRRPSAHSRRASRRWASWTGPSSSSSRSTPSIQLTPPRRRRSTSSPARWRTRGSGRWTIVWSS